MLEFMLYYIFLNIFPFQPSKKINELEIPHFMQRHWTL